MPSSRREFSGLLSTITSILSGLKEELLRRGFDVIVCDTRHIDTSVNLRVTTNGGRYFGFRLVLSARNTTTLLREFIENSLADLQHQEVLPKETLSPLSTARDVRDDVRVYLEIAKSPRRRVRDVVTRVATLISDIVKRWGALPPLLGVHLPCGRHPRRFTRLTQEDLLSMAGLENPPILSTS